MSRPRLPLSPRGALAVLATAAGLAALNVAADAARWRADLTALGSGTLSDETLRVIDEVDRPLRIMAFFGRDDLGRVEAVTLLGRYARANRRISYEVVDPELVPGAAQQLGVLTPGAAAVRVGERVEIAQDTIEIDVTSAIARLLRDRPGVVCLSAGHGERAADGTPSGLRRATGILTANGYTVRTVDLLAAPSVSGDCDAIVVAAPSAPMADAAQGVVDYLRAGGRAMILADPSSDVDLTDLTSPWGIVFQTGTVVERDPSAHLPDDQTSPIISEYFAASPPVRGLPPTFFPGVMQVASFQPEPPRAGLVVGPLGRTSPAAYLERFQADDGFDPPLDVPGPLTVGAAADESEVIDPSGSEASVRRTRIIAWGDVDFATDAFIGRGGNARLFIQAVDWLVSPELLVAAVPNFPEPRRLELTPARASYIRWLTAGIVPAMFVLSGLLVWAIRRGR